MTAFSPHRTVGLAARAVRPAVAGDERLLDRRVERLVDEQPGVLAVRAHEREGDDRGVGVAGGRELERVSDVLALDEPRRDGGPHAAR